MAEVTFPDDLPWMLWYRTRYTVLPTLPRKPVAFIGSSGDTNAHVVRPQIPYGATHWRVGDGDTWKPISELPARWLPFLDRTRPSQMDPRPKLEE